MLRKLYKKFINWRLYWRCVERIAYYDFRFGGIEEFDRMVKYCQICENKNIKRA